MIWLLLLLLVPVPILATRATDPAPGIWHSREEARGYECQRLEAHAAHEQFPTEVPEPPARPLEESPPTLACSPLILKARDRSAREDAILGNLRQEVLELTQSAKALTEGHPTWVVDAFYPDPSVAQKIAAAMRVGLVERGHAVSDRVPLLAAGDLEVLSQLPPEKAYPLACARYRAEKSLGDGEAFLGVMLLDSRETALHAGVCTQGQWRWVR